MKKLFIVLIAGALWSSCSDKGIMTAEVPPAVREAFSARYPEVTEPAWSKEKEKGKLIYEAEWKRDGKEVEAEFDENGVFIREE